MEGDENPSFPSSFSPNIPQFHPLPSLLQLDLPTYTPPTKYLTNTTSLTKNTNRCS